MSWLASTAIDRVADELGDTSHARWTLDELIDYLNDGMRVMAILRPETAQVTETVTLAAGSYQTIPSGGIRLLKLLHNIDADGNPSRAIFHVPLTSLDQNDPNWRGRKQESDVREYAFDNLDPTHFYVSPPVKSGTQARIQYTKAPTPVPRNTDTPKYRSDYHTVDLDEGYKESLVNYMLYRAYRKNEEAADGQRALTFWQLFLQAIGLRTDHEVVYDPATRSYPYSDLAPTPESVRQ